MPELLHILIGAQRGGCEHDALMLVRFLPTIRHRILVLTGDGPMIALFREAGAAVGVLSMSPKSTSRQLISALRDHVTHQPPDAVMIWHGLVWLPYILYALRLLDIRVGVHLGNPATTMPWWADWKLVLLNLRYPAREWPVHICCSQFVADSFAECRYLRGARRVVVTNGIKLPESPRHVPRTLDPNRPVTVGMLARLDRIKDHATLLRAFARFRQRFPLARLELAGTGDQDVPLRALAGELQLGEAVRFLGDVRDTYGAMRHWDLFAYATTEFEGLGNALVEAMMLGLPCVATDIGPIREVRGVDESVLLVPSRDPMALADALAVMAGDIEMRKRLSDQGHHRAMTQFHPQVFADRHREILLGERTNS